MLDHAAPERDATEDARDRSRLVAAAEVREHRRRLARRVNPARTRLVRCGVARLAVSDSFAVDLPDLVVDHGREP